MPLFWTLITFLISLLMLSPVVKSQQNENMNDYEEPEIPVDEAYFDAQKQPEQNYEYQDESAFIKDAQSWRKVIQKQASYAVKDKPEGEPIMVISDSDEEIPPPTTTTTEEPYQSAIDRLSCDDPWFWNAFKCFYLDVRERNYVERTTSNGITVAWFLGPPTAVLLIMLCSFCAVTCYLKSRVKAFERRIEELRNKYEPGSIVLDDGKIRKYTPNQEEINAFENMIETLISIV